MQLTLALNASQTGLARLLSVLRNLGSRSLLLYGYQQLPLLLAVVIAYFSAQLCWGFLYSYSASSYAVAVSNGPQQQLNRAVSLPVLDLTQLKSFKLFGDYSPNAAPQPPALQTKAPKTRLLLELKGVFHGLEGSDSTAIVAESGKVGELYRVGDAIKPGVMLAFVFDDRVMLRRQGQLETLYFPDDLKGASFTSVNSAKVQDPKSKLNLASKRKLTASKSHLGKMIASGRAHSPLQILDAITEDLDANPDATLAELGLKVATGNAGGYAVSSGASRDLLRTLGLRSGDKILSVNGQPLGNPSVDASQIKAALAGKQVSVEIQRGARRFTVNVDVPAR